MFVVTIVSDEKIVCWIIIIEGNCIVLYIKGNKKLLMDSSYDYAINQMNF